MAKEKISPDGYWKLFTEIARSEDQKHMKELLDAIKKTSQEFQVKVVLSQTGEREVKQYE